MSHGSFSWNCRFSFPSSSNLEADTLASFAQLARIEAREMEVTKSLNHTTHDGRFATTRRPC